MGQQNQQRKGKSVQEKDETFIHDIESLFGFPVMPWQRKYLGKIRKSVESNRELARGDLCTCMPTGKGYIPDTHGLRCPERARAK